eukprot:4976031-Prymnesium_polylepis.1
MRAALSGGRGGLKGPRLGVWPERAQSSQPASLARHDGASSRPRANAPHRAPERAHNTMRERAPHTRADRARHARPATAVGDRAPASGCWQPQSA